MNKSIGVVGCGYWGKNLIRNFYELGCLDYVVDENIKIASRFAEQYSAKAISFEELINSEVEGIVISTPAPTHFEIGIKAIKKKKNIFIEKPLTTNLQDSIELVEAAERNNLLLMTGHLMLHHPIYLEIKNLISKGSIGEVRFISSNRFTFGKIRDDEDVLWSFAPHDLSMIFDLASSEIDCLDSTSSIIDLSSNNIDVIHSMFKFNNKIQASLNCSWVSPFKEQKLTIIGTNGSLIFDDTAIWKEKLNLFVHENFEDAKSQSKKSSYNPNYLSVVEGEPLKKECQNFIDSLEDHSSCRSNGRSGLEVVKALTEISNSLGY